MQETLSGKIDMIFELLSRSRGRLRIDSRRVKNGDIFLALKGRKHDGHDFVDHAFENGAILAVVEKRRDYNGDVVEVPDTLSFMKELALHRLGDRCGKTVVAVTGSVGKTTTKELIWHLSGREAFRVPGNLNTPIGVALSLINEYDGETFLILEYGVSFPGDMDEICGFIRPDVGVLLPVGSSHVGNFSSREELLMEKLKLSEYAGKTVAHVSLKGMLPSPYLCFGNGGDVSGRILDADLSRTKIEIWEFGKKFVITLPGVWHEGMVEDLSAAIATCHALGIEPQYDVLESFSMLEGRFRIFDLSGVHMVDDTYNSSIESFRAASKAIDRLWVKSRKVAILGSILEQGKESPRTHRILLDDARRYFDDILIYAPPWAEEILEAVGGEKVFKEEEELLTHLKGMLSEGMVLYFKASHGVELYRVVEKLLGDERK